jgi:spore germination protein GerM
VTRRRFSVIALFAIALGCASCSIPANPTASAFKVGPPVPTCSGSKPVTIYLVKLLDSGAGQLAPVQRPLATKGPDAALCALLELNKGPTTDEASNGLITALDEIPAYLEYLGTVGGVATVGLDVAFLSLAPPQSVYEAFGQIVYTLTASGTGANKVQFEFNNLPYSRVLLPDESAAKHGLVDRSDYCSISVEGCGRPNRRVTSAIKR